MSSSINTQVEALMGRIHNRSAQREQEQESARQAAASAIESRGQS